MLPSNISINKLGKKYLLLKLSLISLIKQYKDNSTNYSNQLSNKKKNLIKNKSIKIRNRSIKIRNKDKSLTNSNLEITSIHKKTNHCISLIAINIKYNN